MPDLTMCKGKNCEIKNSCYRFKAIPDNYLQSYFLISPIKNNGCEYYISNEKNN